MQPVRSAPWGTPQGEGSRLGHATPTAGPPCRRIGRGQIAASKSGHSRVRDLCPDSVGAGPVAFARGWGGPAAMPKLPIKARIKVAYKGNYLVYGTI